MERKNAIVLKRVHNKQTNEKQLCHQSYTNKRVHSSAALEYKNFCLYTIMQGVVHVIQGGKL